MTQRKEDFRPTFVESGTGHTGRDARLSSLPSALRWYNPSAVARYNPTFVDVSLHHDMDAHHAAAPSAPAGAWGMLGSDVWRWYLARGTAMATLLGSLLLSGPSPALAAPSVDPPPPVHGTTDDGDIERLIERIGADSPLWQFVSPGDGTALWGLIERVGPEHDIWDRVVEFGPESWIWERLQEIGADNPLWDEILPEEEQLTSVMAGPDGRPELGASGTAEGLNALVSQAGSTAYFIERTGNANPLVDASVNAWPAPAFVDIDGDGDLDAFVGSSSSTYSYYKGIESEAQTSENLAVRQTADFDAQIIPESDGYDSVTQSKCDGDVQYFENRDIQNGNGLGDPEFVDNPDANPFKGVGFDCRPTPAFVDIDGVGGIDAFFGDEYGELRYFRNVGTATTPNFVEVVGNENPFHGVSLGTNSAPTFVDIDGHGDSDAFVGAGDGTVSFFENVDYDGDQVIDNPSFITTTQAYNPLVGVDVEEDAAPAFVDIDGRGDPDAFIGAYDGTVRFFENLDFDGDSALGDPEFVQRTGVGNPLASVDVGNCSKPTFVDIDGDGDFDAFIGEADGSIRFFENTEPPKAVGGVTASFRLFEAVGSWTAAIAAGLAGTVGAGAALLRRRR